MMARLSLESSRHPVEGRKGQLAESTTDSTALMLAFVASADCSDGPRVGHSFLVLFLYSVSGSLDAAVASISCHHELLGLQHCL